MGRAALVVLEAETLGARVAIMAREPMQDTYQQQHWLLFRRPGNFFYDYAVRYRQRDFEDGECVIECPWLGRTFYSWLWSGTARRELREALAAHIQARSGMVYDQNDGAMAQAYWQETETVLIGDAQARARPLIWGTEAQRAAGRVHAVEEMPVAPGAGVLTISLFGMLARAPR